MKPLCNKLEASLLEACQVQNFIYSKIKQKHPVIIIKKAATFSVKISTGTSDYFGVFKHNGHETPSPHQSASQVQATLTRK